MSRCWIGAAVAAAAILAAGTPAAAFAQPEDPANNTCTTLWLKTAQERLVVMATAAHNVFIHAEPGPEAWKARFDKEYDRVMLFLREYRRCVSEWGEPQTTPPAGAGVTITEPSTPSQPQAPELAPPPPPIIVEPPQVYPPWYRPLPQSPRARGDWRQQLRPQGQRPRDRRQQGGAGKGGKAKGSNCHTNPVTGKLDCNEG